MRILSLESSCDESAAAVLDESAGLLAHRVFSQIDLHQEYGGVVPELAARDHIRKLLPLVRETLEAAGSTPDDIDGIAYTSGPGLIGALLTGASLGRSLAYAWGVPAVGIHHLEGHLLAPILEQSPPEFPFLALLVSGGHTMLVDVQALGHYEILGESLDDAAGEAFDKTAKVLGLPYPGGAHLSALAQKGKPDAFKLPRPMLDRPGLDFSFSGLKTAAQLALRPPPSQERGARRMRRAGDHGGEPRAFAEQGVHSEMVGEEADDQQRRADIALAFERAIVSTLVAKVGRALDQTALRTLVVAGGVGANRRLREELHALGKARGIQVVFPRIEFCTDNAAMIAAAGLWRLKAGQHEGLSIRARARWPLSELGG